LARRAFAAFAARALALGVPFFILVTVRQYVLHLLPHSADEDDSRDDDPDDKDRERDISGPFQGRHWLSYLQRIDVKIFPGRFYLFRFHLISRFNGIWVLSPHTSPSVL
jgi:hypothetical protein